MSAKTGKSYGASLTSSSEVWRIRILLASVSVLYFAWHYILLIHNKPVVDPFVSRILICAFFAGLFISSYVQKWTDKQARLVSDFIPYLPTSHFFYVMHVNNYDIVISSLLFMYIFGGYLCVQSRKSYFIYSAYMMTCLANTYFHVDATFSWNLFFFGMVTQLFLCGLGLHADLKVKGVLAERRKFIEGVTNSIPEIIYIYDTKINKAVYSNSEVYQSLGYTPNEISEKGSGFLNNILHPEDANRVLELKNEIVNTKEDRYWVVEFRVVSKDGSERWLRGHYSVFERDEFTGLPSLIMGVAQDVTEQKRSAEILKLQHISATQSAKFASLGQLAAGMAHEINNPLAIILLTAGKIKRQISGAQANEKIFESAELIEKTSVRISKIVDGLRVFARDDSGDQFVKSEMSSVINDTLSLCQERLKNHGVELRTYVEKGVLVRANSQKLTQVFLNLIMNAFDAIVEGRDDKWIEVKVETRANEALVSITDSGPGISADVRAKIMEPFFTTKSVGKGTGLGLSISKGIIESHNGRLYYDETSPHTRFVVKLPLFNIADESRVA